jgi:hypothetical protein
MAFHIAFKNGNGRQFHPSVWNKKRDDKFASMIATNADLCRRMERMGLKDGTDLIPGPLLSFYNTKTHRIIWIADQVY